MYSKIAKLIHFALALPKFPKIIGVRDYIRILHKELIASSKECYTLRIRQNGGKPVELRPCSSDCSCLLAVYYDQYHLPPSKLPENALILDLGCNVGYTVAHYACLYPGATVIGLEMDAGNHRLATNNTRAYPECQVRNQALAVSDGVFYYTSDADEVAYCINANREYRPGKDIQVEAVSMKTLCNAFQDRIIDYVKMDIEGEDDRIFADENSDLSWLEKVNAINIEVHSGHAAIQRIISLLQRFGFKAWKDAHTNGLPYSRCVPNLPTSIHSYS